MSATINAANFLMLSVFGIAAVGYLLGRITIKGISLGTAGVFVIALIYGAFSGTHFNSKFVIEEINYASQALKIIENLGLVFFVTSVGFIAGPNFFKNMKHNFKSYVLLGVVIILSGGITAVLCLLVGRAIEAGQPGYDPNQLTAMISGLLAGSLTSTPAFSATKEAVAAQYQDAVTVGYGIAYLFGVIGVVLFVQLMPRVVHVTRMLTSGIDAIHAQFPLTALFGPEHGVRGDHDAGATVETYTDPATRLPVYSLYRKDSQHMTPEMLDLVDTVIYDIQDIGARFYTYISTLLYVMRDCAAAGKELVVLDRINPLGGKVEGGLLQPGFESFVGAYPLTTRYGLTPGEFARLANEEQHIGCQLHVLPVLGWKREMLFPETGLYWMMPSPAIPNFETALLYPGTCLTEATNISEGRGTSAPFELIGAPFINGAALADRMNAKKLPGVIFTAAYFTPSASKHAGRRCEGVHIHLTDTKAYDTIRTGTALLYAIREIYPNDFALRQPEDEKALLPINRLTGSDVLAHDWPDFDALMERWENEAKAFDERAVFARMYE